MRVRWGRGEAETGVQGGAGWDRGEEQRENREGLRNTEEGTGTGMGPGGDEGVQGGFSEYRGGAEWYRGRSKGKTGRD